MKSDLGWDDIGLFAVVGRHASLTQAAAETGISVATLSRRLRAFEAKTGRRLFQHGAAGYALTAEGRSLFAKAADMERAAAEIEAWRKAGQGPIPVRISAGMWTGADLAANLRRYWSPDANWLPEFINTNQKLDIARREVDIGVRNRRPEQPWLAARKIGTVNYAIFARDHDVEGWIGSSGDAAATRTSAWVQRHHGAEIVTRANHTQLGLSLAQAGLGRIVLPLSVVRDKENLVQIGPVIDELQTEEWLVTHHEARHEPAIRAALEALAGYLTARGG